VNRWRRVLVAAGLVLTACTSTAPNPGPSSVSTPPSSTPPSSTPPSSTPLSSSTSVAPFPPADLARVPGDSAIGDPATADLCAAAGLAVFRDLAADLTPSVDPEQYPPGCSITLQDADQPVFTVSVFAAQHAAREAEGRTKATVHGLPVFGYPFDAATGSCERDVVAPDVLLVADTLARGDADPGEELSCAAADAMADRMALAAAGGAVDRLALAAPSVTELDACAVARQAGITELRTFATARAKRRGFDLNCELRTDTAFLFINIALVDTTRAVPGDSIQLGGHDLLQHAVQPRYCSYASAQGSSGDGVQEQVTATATATGDGAPPANLCPDTAQALARYLSAAGLA
jgi:hypothetical protein